MKDLFRPGSPFTAWVVGIAILFVVVEFVNPAIWYSADVLGTARIIAATGGAAAAGIVGALLGALIGLIASVMAAKKPAPADKKAASRALAKARSRNAYIVTGCIVASAAFAAYNLTFTSEKASFVACTTVQHDLDAAQAGLAGAPGTTIAKVNDALGQPGLRARSAARWSPGALHAARRGVLPTDLAPDAPTRISTAPPKSSRAAARTCRDRQGEM